MIKGSPPSHETLSIVAKLWNLEPHLEFVRRVENWVYGALLKSTGQRVYVRFTEPSHRTEDLLIAELHFASHIASTTHSAVCPIYSANGKYVEKLESTDSEFHFVSVLEEACGQPLKTVDDFTNTAMQDWGRTIARFHNAMSTYSDLNLKQRRPDWDQIESFQTALKFHKPEDGKPYSRYKRLLDWTKTLPRDSANYGLIHCDIHIGNFHYSQKNGLKVFDFDDCVYHWFLFDLAVSIINMNYYSYNKIPGQNAIDFSKQLIDAYLQERKVSESSLATLPNFIELRMLNNYYWIDWAIAEAQLDPSSIEWFKKYQNWILLQINHL